MAGGRLLWETPLDGLRIGGSAQALRLDTHLLYGPSAMLAAPTLVSVQIPAVLGAGAIEYARHGLLLAAEYGRWFVDVKSSDPTLFPARSVTSERAYFMANYQVRSWFQPSVYYSVFYPDVTQRIGREHVQHDVAGTLRFDINSFWLVKLEAH